MQILCKWESAAIALAERQTSDLSEEQAIRLLTDEGKYINPASGNLFPFPSPSGSIDNAKFKLMLHRERTYQEIINALHVAGKITFYSNLTRLKIAAPSQVEKVLVDIDELASLIVQHGEEVTVQTNPNTDAGQCTIQGIRTIRTLSRPAFEAYQIEVDSRRSIGRYTLEEAALLISEAEGERAEAILLKLESAAKSRTFKIYESSSKLEYDGKTIRPDCIEVHGFELNAWLTVHAPLLSFRFPEAQSAPAAILEAATVTQPAPADWKVKALAIADQIAIEKYRAGQREITQRNICDAVATKLAEDETTHGQRGPRDADAIRTTALKGWKFTPP